MDQIEEFARNLDAPATPFFAPHLNVSHVRDVLIPRWRASAPDTPICIWSIACGVGCDAYSLAAILKRELTLPFRILATDADPARLEIARNGVFPIRRFEEILGAYQGFFRLGTGDVSDWFAAPTSLKDAITFRPHTLDESPYPVGRVFDLIVCPTEINDLSRRKLAASAKPGASVIIASHETVAE